MSRRWRSDIAETPFAAMHGTAWSEGIMSCRSTFIVLVTALLGALATSAQAGPDIHGVWLTQAGDAKVRIGKCGGGICGVVIWLKEPIDPATGKPQVDDKNPNPALARRPIIGLALFSRMRLSGLNKWTGQIYDADDGKSYASNISLTGADRLRVEGCVGVLWGGEPWTRAAR